MKRLRVSEIYPAVQGEGPVVGVPTIMVRLGGCDYRCTWCDSMHSVDPSGSHQWPWTELDDLVEEIDADAQRTPILVTLTGGNPVLQDCGPLVDELHEHGHEVLVETQGSVWKDWVQSCDMVVVSPKPPSSGMVANMDVLQQYLKRCSRLAFKFVVADETDFDWVRDMRVKLGLAQVYLQPCNPDPTLDGRMVGVREHLERYTWLCDKVMKTRWHGAICIPQMHVLAWGNERGR